MKCSLMGSRLLGLVVGVLLLGMVPAGANAQQSGSVTGQVLDANTKRPLVGVQVFVVGTNRSSITNQEGRYLITGVSPGEHTVRTALIGYGTSSQAVSMQSGAAVTTDFELAVSAVELDALVINAITGQAERRREMGNSVANINLAEVDLAPVQSFTQLIQGRAAGVSVMQSAGTSGTGARVRIRGSNSISLSNEPLVIIDGIQVDRSAASSVLDLGGQEISRMNDFNPEEIESIEVLKGPAASALYGTAAANGVIQITTRRGRAGTARWNFYSEYGQMKDVTTYPSNWLGVATTSSGGLRACDLVDVTEGDCTQSELRSWNPLMKVPPFRTGTKKTLGMNVSGGTDQVQYFVSGSVEDEDGIYKNNSVDKLNLRANMDAQVRDDLSLAVRTGYTRSDLSFPINDNAAEGFISAGLLGSASDNPVTRGYFAFPNEYRFALSSLQYLHRFMISTTANWRPSSWLSFNATGGMDLMSRKDVDAVEAGIWDPDADPDYAIGSRGVYSALIRTHTGRANAVGTFDLTPTIVSTTIIGGELRQDRLERSDAWGYNMLAGTNSLGSLSDRYGINEVDQLQRTVSTMASQQFSWQDRVFVTGSVRGDRNSNFGREFGFQWYPAFSTSWVLGEEDWFPESEVLSSFRVRTAWGRSGLMPNFRTAQKYYSATVATIAENSVPAITIGGAGNVDLRPEQSSEWEFGFDAGLFNDRIGLEFGYYDKKSTDALVSRRLAPSLGSSTVQTVNLGQVTNSGFEALINGRVLSIPEMRWDAVLSLSTNKNKLVRLGEGVEPIIYGIGGDSQRHAEGLPLGHYYGLELLSWKDANNDGMISLDEVEVGTAPTMLGRQFPTRELSLTSTMTLFDRIRLVALIDHRGGHQLFNSTEEFRCVALPNPNCRGMNDPDAPLFEQARAMARLKGSIEGYVEDADFTKLREVSLTLLGVERWLGQAGIRGLQDVSLTFSGRNLMTWTKYGGSDPEMNSAGQSNMSSFDFLGQPPIRHWMVRLNVVF